ncbi:uncharacterized protein [Anabrus simplex]|uniref:uncharacterized protein isoform X2 n=1 Tax=Anabrus simplex TaxID=316456 RepID=UPI0034DCE52A
MVCVLLLQQPGPGLSGNLSSAVYTVHTCITEINNVMSGEGDDTSDGVGKQNDTDGPNESVYMICGVLIAMLLVGLIIVILAVTISKLRKRDDNQNSDIHPQDLVPDVVLQTTTTTTTGVTMTQQGQVNLASEQTPGAVQQPPQFLWQYPAQYSLYGNDQDTLVHPLPAERPGFCRGFRKNLRGRWRRLVKRKPSQEVYTIPAELRDQLKQIYVY